MGNTVIGGVVAVIIAVIVIFASMRQRGKKGDSDQE